MHALRDVSLHVPQGKIFGVIGGPRCRQEYPHPLRQLCWSAPPRGRSPSMARTCRPQRAGRLQARRQIGMTFQHFNLLASHRLRQHRLPLGAGGWSKDKIQSRVSELLALVELEARPRLSVGLRRQKRRVAIARALALAPLSCCVTEATSALYPQTCRS